MILSAGGTCFAAVANTSLLLPESGVSFSVAPAVSSVYDFGTNGSGFSGGTVYVLSAGGMVYEDMSGGGTGVTLWQVRSDGQYAEIIALGTDPYTNNGANNLTGVTTAGVASLTIVPSSGRGGVSIFAVINNFTGYGTAPAGVTGFTIGALSHDSQNRIAGTLACEAAGVSDVVVWNPPAYTSNWMQNSTTVSGDSLFFATSWVTGFGLNPNPVPGTSAALWPNGGSTLYCLKANQVNGAVDTADANNVLAYRYESLVSGFASGPVIKEGRSGISVFILGALGPASYTSGVSLLGYQGANFAAVGNAGAPQINYRIDPGPGQYHIADGIGNLNGVTQWPTPALGKGALNWGRNNYSGNSLFVTDGLGGVSVFDVNIAANTTQAGVVLRHYQYSNDAFPSSVTPIPGPVTNGQYLVLPSATGVSIYESDTGAIMGAAGANTNSFIAGYEFTVAQGYDVWNWYTSGTPAISNGYVMVPITSNQGAAVGEFRTAGRILFFRLTDGALIETYNLNNGSIAPIAVASNNDGNFVWAVDYNSSIDRILPELLKLEAQPYWYQFKFDAAKTGDNTQIEDDDDWWDDDGGCFINTVK
jgi:hypothetical protein